MEEITAGLNALTTIIVTYLIAIAIITITISVIIIKAFIKYAAKKNAEAFHYDELAKKIAGEIMRTQLYMQQQVQQPMISNQPAQPTQPAQPEQPAQPARQAKQINHSGSQQSKAAPEPRQYRPPWL